MAANVPYYGPDPNDPRRYGHQHSVTGGHPYYNRYIPSWLYDPYRLNMAEKEERVYHSEKEPKVQAIAYSQAFDNAGYYSTSSLKKAGNYNLGSEGQGEDSTRRATRKRSCHIILGIIFVAILLIAALVVGLYFGVFQKPEPSKPEATTTVRPTSKPATTVTTETTSTTSGPTTPKPATAVSFEVLLTLEEVYSTALDDPGNPSYTSLQNGLENLIDSILKTSDLSDWYIDSAVTGFRRGSIKAPVKVDFSSKIVRFGNQFQDQVLDDLTVKAFIRQGLLERPQKVATFGIRLDEIIVEKLTGVGNLDLGEECVADSDCSDRYTECSVSGLGAPLCRCIYGYYDSNTDVRFGGTCNEKIPYEGRTCTEKRHCATLNAICLNEQCVCDMNTHFYMNGACLTKLKLNDVCEDTSECAGAADGVYCSNNKVCSCNPTTHYYQDNQCVKLKVVGESGCQLDSHCANPGARCLDYACVCNPKTLYYTGRECAPKKSNGQVCSYNIMCISDLCQDNLCGCQDNEFYDGTVCQPKKQIGEVCMKDLECAASKSYCDSVTGRCTCSPSTYPVGNKCWDATTTQTTKTTSKETSKTTTTQTTKTTPREGGYGSDCYYNAMCNSEFICSAGKCECRVDSYYDGTACISTTTIQTTETTSKETMTPSTTAQPQCKIGNPLEGVSCGGLGPTGPIGCPDPRYECVGEALAYDGPGVCCLKSDVTMTTTVTTPMTTPAPVELPTVDLYGEVTSTAPYDDTLNDTNSSLYKSYSESVRTAVEDEFLAKGEVVHVTNVLFSEGSINISFTLEVVVRVELTPQSQAEVADLPNLIVEKLQPLLTEIVTAMKEKPDAPGFLKQIDTNKTPLLRPVKDTPPCKDGERMINYAETGLSRMCGVILHKLQENPDEGVCANYQALIDCITLMYMYDDVTCTGNTIQANFNGKVAKALGLNPGKIMQCIPGYIFEPVDQIHPEAPCMDVNLMFLTAWYECPSYYGNMWLPSSDHCRLGNELSACMIDKMKIRYGCQEAVYNDLTNNALTMLVTYQTRFYPTLDWLHLEECEYCTSPNIEHVMLTRCSSALQYMNLWSWPNADCTNLQMMIFCVEAYTLQWTTGFCPPPDVLRKIGADSDRFYLHFSHVTAFQGRGFTQCLEGDFLNQYGATRDVCLLDNYIAYLFVYECTDFERIGSGLVTDQCSENLRALQCVQSRIEKDHNERCFYNSTFSAVWLKDYDEYSIVNMLKMSGFPGSDCGDHYQTVAGQCQVVFFNYVETIKDKCLPPIDKGLETRIMSTFDLACGVYAEATRCAQRDVLVSWCPLEDIEPAVRVGLFRNYTDVSNCPSQGFGSYDKEVICNEMDSLGAKMLTKCGQYLLSPMSGYSEHCSGLTDFGQCVMSDYTTLVNTCGRLTVALAFDRLEDILTSDKGFQISRSCFTEHPGVCRKQYQGNCTDTNSHWMPCLLDGDCGRLEKCCSSGCDMRCTTDIIDSDPDVILQCPNITDDVTCTTTPVNACVVSGHCNGSQVCCWDGCSHRCYSPEPGDIKYPEDCRNERIIKAAIDACEEHRYMAAHSCRSFSRVVDCVQEKLDNASRSGVYCKIEQTRDDVAHHLRGEIGMHRHCRVYAVDLKIDDYDNCQLIHGGSSAFENYIEEITPMLEAVLQGMENTVHKLDIENENICGPVIVNIWVFKVDTVIDLYDLISATIKDLRERGLLQKDVELLRVLYKYGDFDQCLDPPSIGRTMVEKCLKSFTDTVYPYPGYQVCRPVYDLASCIETFFVTYCETKKIKVQLYTEKDLILQRLRMHDNMTEITRALERYDYSECEDRGDVYPCSDSFRLEDALVTCTMNVDHSGYNIHGASGLTKELCRHFDNITSCVTGELRGLGANCNFTDYGVNAAAYKFVREKIPQGYLLPGSHKPVLEFCSGYMSVCSPAFIYQSIEHNCSVPYFFNNTNSTCSSTEAKQGFGEFVTCLLLHALARDKNDCTASRIVSVIRDDPHNLDLFNKTTDVHKCIGDLASTLDSELADRSRVCKEKISLNYFAQKCNRRHNRFHCSPDGEITDSDFICSKHFQQSSCITDTAYNMSFVDCRWDDIAEVDLTGTLLELDSAQRQYCNALLAEPQYLNCKYKLLMKKEWFHHCYFNLHGVDSAASTVEKCSVFYGSLNCMKNVYTTNSDWFSCWPGTEDNAVRETLLTFLQIDAYSHYNCSWQSTMSYGDMFNECTEPPVGDICVDNTTALTTLVLSSCADNITSMVEYSLNNTLYYTIEDNTVKMCSFYKELVMCGVNTTHRLYHKCSKDQVDLALQQNFHQWSHIFPVITINPQICKSHCYMGSSEVRKCLREDVVHNFGMFDPMAHGEMCRYSRAMDYYWHCVKRHLYDCDESAVTAHVMLTMMNVSMFSPACTEFSPSPIGDEPNMCDNATDLGKAAFMPCLDYMIGINEAWMSNQTCNYSVFENLTRCVDGILALYSYDCVGSKREGTVKKGILTIARLYQDESLQRCFYDSVSGYCPIREGRSQMTECRGPEYSYCDSDWDCGGYDKKCCFDGCGYSCISPALEPAVWAVQFEFYYESWKPAYNRTNSTEAKVLISKYQIYAILRNFSEPRYMVLAETYSGKVLLKAQIYSFYNPWYHLNQGIRMLSDPELVSLTVMFLEQKYPGEAPDHCSDVGKIAEAALTCIDDRFRDSNTLLQKWEICRGVNMLAECIQQQLRKQNSDCSIHQLRGQIANHSHAIEMKLENHDFGQWQNIKHALKNFDYGFCEDNYYYDKYPCDDSRLKDRAWDECRWSVDVMLSHLNYDQQGNYNVTPHDCRQFYTVSACVLERVREAGAQCNWYDVASFVYNKTRKEITNGYVLPEDMQKLDFCWEYVPVCSAIYLLSNSECTRYSLYYADCGSGNFTTEFSYYLTCLRLKALSHPEEQQNCTIHRIIELIEKDPYNYGVISTNVTEIGACLGANVIKDLEASLMSPDAVCRNGQVLSHFAKDCVTMGSDRCEVDWSSVVSASDIDVACTMYLRYVECIRVKMTNMSFDCTTSDITEAAIPALHLPDNLQSYCLNKLNTVPDYRECDYSLINTPELEPCYSGLGNISFMSFYGDMSRTCSVYAESVHCLTDNIHCYIHGSVPRSVTEPHELLLHMLQASEIISSNVTCMDINAVTDFNKYFGGCMDTTATEDLCGNQPVLRDITLLNCSVHTKDIIMRFFSTGRSSSWYNIAPCRLLDQMVMCGQKAASRLGSECTPGQVHDSLTATPEMIRFETMVPFSNGIDPPVCTAQPCYTLNDDARKCVNLETVYYINSYYRHNDTIRCRAYDYLWHCVKTNLNNSYCEDDTIEAHLTFSLMEATNYLYSYWNCSKPSVEPPNLCTDYETLAELGPVACWEPLSELYHGFTDMYGHCVRKEETIQCFTEILDTYNRYGCTAGEKESTVAKAIVLAARREHYSIEHCFDMKSGNCPFVDTKYRHCYGDEPSTCVLDYDCSGKQRCCYDGCASACVEVVMMNETAEFLILLQLRNEQYLQHYSNFYSPVTQKLVSKYFNDLKSFLTTMDRFEVIAVSEWSGLATFEVKVWSYTDPNIALSSNETYSEYFYLVSVNYTSVLPDKPGACPPVFTDDSRTYAYTNWCRDDRGCSYDHKCCPNRRGVKVCAPPAPVFPACDDTERILCDVSISSLAKDLNMYTCSTLMKKFDCFMDQLNEDRPPFYECNGTIMREKLLSLRGYSSVQPPFDLYNCAKWTLTVMYYNKICDGKRVPAVFEERFKTQVLPELLADLDYEFRRSRCRLYSNMYEFTVHITTDKSETQIYNILYGTDIFINESYSFNLKRLSLDIDRCTDIPTLEYLTKECVKKQNFWYEDYQICRPIYAAAYCVRDKISSYTGGEKYCESEDIVAMLFDDNTKRQEFYSSLQSSPSNSTDEERRFLDALARYSVDKCPNGDQDIYPCDDFKTKMRIYDTCRDATVKSTVYIDSNLNNYGMTADNCREFFLLTSCVLDEFSELRIQCWGIEQFVYDQLKKQFDTMKELPSNYRDLSFCEAHQPVCSSLFIDSVRHKCPWNQNYWYRLPDCTASSDTEIMKKFITCVRLFALSRNQGECTPGAIKQIIKGNYFKLNVMNKRADIDKCLPDSAIDNILPSRASVCTGGEPIALYESQCSRYNNLTSYNQTGYNNQTYYNNSQGPSDSAGVNYTNYVWPLPGPCSTTPRDVAEAGSVNLACMLYLSQMSCVHVILKNMSFACTMDQLANSPVPDDTSPFYLPEHRSQCLVTYNSAGYKDCDAGLLKSPVALACSAVLVNTTYAPLQDEKGLLCQVYQETLGCYDRFAKAEKLSCSVEQLHQFQLSTTALAEYSRRPWSECDNPPQVSPYDICEAVLLVGDLCSSPGRLAPLVIGVCSGIEYNLPKFNDTDNIDENILVCKWLQSVVWCGTNVTSLVNNGNPCSAEQVRSNILSMNDLVVSMSSYNVLVCQDGCYDSEAAVSECIHPYVWIWNMDSCRIYTYMWQCLNSRLRQKNGQYCSNTIIKSTIAANLPSDKRHWIHSCPDPRWNPLEICSNVTDVALLSGYRCSQYLWNMSRGDCSRKEEAGNCYQNVLSAFGSDCYTQEMTIMKAMVLGGQNQGYDVKDCIDDNFKHKGYCPTPDTYCAHSSDSVIDIGECLLDTECGVTQKCCYYSCNFTCRDPRPEPARWTGSITFKNETYLAGMDDNSSSIYLDFIHRYETLRSMMSRVFYKFEFGRLRKGSVVTVYYVWHPRQPSNTLHYVMDVYFPGDSMYIEIGYPYRSEVERPGKCPTHPGGIDNICSIHMFNPCEYDSDCAMRTAKCCYTNCGSPSYGKRCIDQAAPPSAYQYTLIFRPLDEDSRPIPWQYEFSYDSFESKSLRERYDYLFQKMFDYYSVTGLKEDDEHYVNLLLNVSSYKTRDGLKDHIYANIDYTVQLMDLYYEHGPPVEKNCSDQVTAIGYKCWYEMNYFLDETDEEKKCRAYKTLVDCMGSGENCNSTQMRHFFKENIKHIGKLWLANMTDGLNSSRAYHLEIFDAWQCTDNGTLKTCGDHIYAQLDECNYEWWQFLYEKGQSEKCWDYHNLTSCIQHHVKYLCAESEVRDYLRNNTVNLGMQLLANSSTGMNSWLLEDLQNFNIILCDEYTTTTPAPVTTSSPCYSNQYHCKNGNCVYEWYRCDKYNHCGDNSDEWNCESTTSSPSWSTTPLATRPPCPNYWEFRCNNGRCISSSARCNKSNDCGDNSDEWYCESTTTSPWWSTTRSPCPNYWEFRCNNGRCISSSARCNKSNDCGDNSDEWYCESTTTSPWWSTTRSPCPNYWEFRCNNGRCISSSARCNKSNDCGDNSDEWYCESTTTSPWWSTTRPPCPNYWEFKCNNGRCISSSARCNKSNDCGDNSDEWYCESTTTSPWWSTTRPPCPNYWEFKCNNGRCISSSARCNKSNDCGDNSDEWYCESTTTSPWWSTIRPPCTNYWEFRCNNGRCISSSARCNKSNDCGDNSDEWYCESTTTSPWWSTTRPPCPNYWEFRCNNGRCISSSARCNKSNDCGDNSDEWYCESTTTSPWTTSSCQWWQSRCEDGRCADRYEDCGTITTTQWPCQSWQYRCGDGRCVDRYEDCGTTTTTQRPITTDWSRISGHTDYPSTCKTSEFMCNNGQCIPGHWECDDFMDCTDESDEHHDCHATTDWPTTPPIMDYPSTCDSTEFHCESGSDYGNCIPSVWKCDQFDDCYEGTDELDCSPSSTTSWIRTTTATTNFGPKCSHDYMMSASKNVCASSFGRWMVTSSMERCRHFEQFLGCIKYQVLLNSWEEDKVCTVQKLEGMAQYLWGDQGTRICQTCNDYSWSVNNYGKKEAYIDIKLDKDNATRPNASVTVEVYSFDPQKQWFGVGVSYDNKMSGSDIYIAHVDNGQWTVTDRYAQGQFDPKLDVEIQGRRDLFTTYGSMDGGTAKVTFTRLRNTQDDRDVPLTFDRHLLFARGERNGNYPSRHTFRAASDIFLFNCEPYSALDKKFPNYREEICRHSLIHRHLWEYLCLSSYYSATTDHETACRQEIEGRHCVLRILEEAHVGCTMDDVIEVSQRPEVRKDILGDVDPACQETSTAVPWPTTTTTDYPRERCSKQYMDRARYESCVQPYSKLLMNVSAEENCRHYEAFLACVKFHTLISGEYCHISTLDQFAGELYIRVYTIYKTQCFDFSGFEEQFPDTVAEICHNVYVVRKLLEYNCMLTDPNVLTDPLDKCRVELSYRGCVTWILKDSANCTTGDVEVMMRRDDVRDNLLTGVTPDYCDANLQDGECMYNLLMVSQESQRCLIPLFSLPVLNNVTNVNDMYSAAQDGKKLKCSLLEQAMSCILTLPDLASSCTTIPELLNALNNSMRLYINTIENQLKSSGLTIYFDPDRLNIDFSDCAVQVISDWTCPSTALMTDMILGQCSFTVLYAVRTFNLQPCSMVSGFYGCVETIPVPEECPKNHANTSVEQHRQAFQNYLGGFDPVSCGALAKCKEVMTAVPIPMPGASGTESIDSTCLKLNGLNSLLYTTTVNDTEKCHAAESLRGSAEGCMKQYLWDECQALTSNLWEDKMTIYRYTGFNYSLCSDMDIDQCSYFTVSGYAKCYDIYTSGYDHCKFLECFRSEAPAECQFTEQVIQQKAEEAFRRFVFSMVFDNCGDT